MQSMTVTELKELLECMESEGNGEAEVRFAYDYGDHWRTQVAATVEDGEMGTVANSEYHRMDKVLEDGEEGKAVFILR